MADYSNDEVLDPNKDYVVRLQSGEGLWVAVETDWGQKLVKISVDLPTGACHIRTWNEGGTDEELGEPNNEILEPFA